MTSYAGDTTSIAMKDKFPALNVLFHTTTWASLMAFAAVASFLSIGLLWPAAAVASSILTTCVREYLYTCSKERCLATDALEVQDAAINYAKDTNASQSYECEHASFKPAVQNVNAVEASAVEVSGTCSSSIVAASVMEGVAQSCTNEHSSDVGKQISQSVFEPLAEASLDRVTVSLTRSADEDWGFAWQVGAYGAKRFVLVHISTSSPMDFCNASRQAQGESTIASGDELVCVGNHSDFDAMQKALASEISLELTFLNTKYVPPVSITSMARRQKNKPANRAASKVSAFEKSHETGKDVREVQQRGMCAEASHTVSRTAFRDELLLDSCFEMVQAVKNTFIEFQLIVNSHTEKLAQSDPTPMLLARQVVFRDSARSENDEGYTNDYASFQEHASSGENFPHFDTNDMYDLMEEGLIIQDSVVARQTLSLDDLVKKEPEDRRELTKEAIHQDFAKADQLLSSEPLALDPAKESSTPRFHTMEFDCFSQQPPVFLKNSNNSSDLPMKPLRSETSLSEHSREYRPDEIRTTEPTFYNDMLALDYRNTFLKCTSRNSHVGTSCPIPLASSPEFLTASHASSSNVYASDFLSTRFFSPSCKEPSNSFSQMGQYQPLGTSALISQHDSSLCIGAPVPHEISFTAFRESSVAECFSTQPAYRSVAPVSSEISATSANSNESAQTSGSCSVPHIPRLDAKKNQVLSKTQEQGQSAKREFLPQIGEDWYCPICFDLQFRANSKCRMCGLPCEQGVKDLRDLDANQFLQGHRVTAHMATKFRNLAPELQQTVMSGGSLHGARDPTAVLSNRIRKAVSLASASPSPVSSPVKLGFDRRQSSIARQCSAGNAWS